eukprot:m.96034 g.96034  ORF g.96034 m.96034 type:complete len:761 (+) comp12453_c0_seq1:50-2332(+)
MFGGLCGVVFVTAVVAVLCLPYFGCNGQVVLEDLYDKPVVALKNTQFTFKASFSYDAGRVDYTNNTVIYYQLLRGGDVLVDVGNFSAIDRQFHALDIEKVFEVTETKAGYHTYTLEMDVHPSFDHPTSSSMKVHVIPGGLTLLPPLLTIIIVITTKHVLLSLFTGVYVACFLIYRYNPITAFCRTFDTIILDAFSDTGHVEVVMFTWFLSGMVACVLKTGGGEGLAKAFSKWATSPRAGSIVTVVLGLLIFFDGIANTLIVGQTVRPITDLLGISREKLAYLVDGTSSPVTSISPISTWVGFELSLIDNILTQLGPAAACYDDSAFIIFVKTIPGRFYPFLMICLQLYLIVTEREYGPMLKAERNARRNKSNNINIGGEEDEEYKQFEPDTDTPKRWWNAAVPVIVTTLVVIISLIVTGVDGARQAGVPLNGREIFGHSDSYAALLYGSVLGSLSIWILAVLQRVESTTGNVVWWSRKNKRYKPLMTLSKSLDTWIAGIKSLTFAVLILLLAWSVGIAFTLCGTATFISHSLSGSIAPGSYPAVTFLVSAFLAVVTGSSWGTMGIVFPLIIPAAHNAAPCNHEVFYGTIASVLAGAVFGDHCSPISDTTILSSIACRCNLTQHVKTQLPYALLAGIVGLLLGDLPTGFEAYPTWVGLLISIVTVLVIAHLLSAPIKGTKIDHVTTFVAWVSRAICNRSGRVNVAGQQEPYEEEDNMELVSNEDSPLSTKLVSEANSSNSLSEGDSNSKYITIGETEEMTM